VLRKDTITSTAPITASIRLRTSEEALELFGENDKNLKRLREKLGAKIIARGDAIKLEGTPEDIRVAESLIRDLLSVVRQGGEFSLDEIDRGAVISSNGGSMFEDTNLENKDLELPKRLRPKTKGQKAYIEAINSSDITFGIGPAGTGKSYLAVAMAVAAFKAKRVKRIILTRPAVEAGERLGFLPGDLQAKIDPYLRPLYDALFDMIDAERFESYLSSGAIEVAPLAFMRGRAQPLTSKVLTPLGWREMGSLEVGDYVIGSNGKPTQVLEIFPQGEKDAYRVTMTDGSSTLCCEEHLWTVMAASDKRRGKPARTLETREMIGNLKSAHQYRYELPMLSEPLEFAAREIPLDPYALGLLLGDGCITGKNTPSFASNDPELVIALEKALIPLEVQPVFKGKYDYTLKYAKGGRGGVIVQNPLTLALRALKLEGTRSSSKFIPEVYLNNTSDVRLAVLQGLLDTDGNACTQTGRTCRVQYVTTSKKLRDDVINLVRSLGGVAYTRTRVAEGRKPGHAQGCDIPYRSDAFVLEIRLPQGMKPFRLERKAVQVSDHGADRPMRFISSIEAEGREAMQCIRVSANDHLYLTDDYILTHNTLNDAFIILDEAQNTTPEQMKMFLTRMGFSSKVVVTGDVTQVDLPKSVTSGLEQAKRYLQGIDGINFVYFTESDVVRHPLVGRIIHAYEEHS
jgi:phosphate starvation-inducible protein PhoH and related proteins